MNGVFDFTFPLFFLRQGLINGLSKLALQKGNEHGVLNWYLGMPGKDGNCVAFVFDTRAFYKMPSCLQNGQNVANSVLL